MHTPPTQLVLSVFPGIDLLGQAFEQSGFCVVRGPDLIFGGDIRTFTPPPDKFTGVIGGPPCQDFSAARRTPPTGNGDQMLAHYTRVVTQTKAAWALMENVPGVPNITIPGYLRQRIDVRGTEVGLLQRRIRHFQFFTRDQRPLCVPRSDTPRKTEPAVTASEARHQHRRTFAEFCQLQGLHEAPDLEGFTKSAKYRAVGNGVPLPMGKLLADAIWIWLHQVQSKKLCRCGCARPIRGNQISATAACRKRLERRRRSHALTNDAQQLMFIEPAPAGGLAMNDDGRPAVLTASPDDVRSLQLHA